MERLSQEHHQECSQLFLRGSIRDKGPSSIPTLLYNDLQLQPHTVDPDLQRGLALRKAFDVNGRHIILGRHLSDLRVLILVIGARRPADDADEPALSLFEGDCLLIQFRRSGGPDRALQCFSGVKDG